MKNKRLKKSNIILFSVIGVSSIVGITYGIVTNLPKKYPQDSFGTLPNKKGYLAEFPIKYKRNEEKIQNTLPSEINKNNLNELIEFSQDVELSMVRPYDSQGCAILGLLIPKGFFSKEKEKAILIIKGLKKSRISLLENEITFENGLSGEYNKYRKNQVMFTVDNGEYTSSANGVFIDYLINNNEDYPLTWYMLTNIHTLNNYWNSNNYYKYQSFFTKAKQDSKFTLYNRLYTDKITQTPKVVFMGFDIFDSNLNKFKEKLHVENYEDDLEEFIDLAIVEVKFDNAEQAKKFTRIDWIDFSHYRYNDLNYLPLDSYFPYSNQYKFQKLKASDTFLYEEENKVKVLEGLQSYLSWNFEENKQLKKPFIYNRFLTNNESIINIKDKKFVDISTAIGINNTAYGAGSSGSLAYIGEYPIIKYADYDDQMGLWIPLWWSEIDRFKKFINEKDINYTLYDDFIIEGYNLIFGGYSNQKNWYLKSFSEIHPDKDTFISKNYLNDFKNGKYKYKYAK
ncbi:hypothetical protein DP067_00160 [Mycoplasmopsis anatis]|uniref:DUF31 domain-containing protein n=1 Tax=Mycoplasmopsis anatis 1340 TaxID=1034808 RepID=F9QCT9_9BACT|nr:hypothetical protein [Mycoplasmopsis anatis]AWX69796.1 hypothetical protein DP067_00160 [Mycoplasmopsis anatis]EGS29430.1 hypothetical protein GIG_01241 [Mycoplasmopsis anatis 1340]VEU73787.1 Uncharacterised protein [Mycoplasmopsis anatis]